MFSTKNLQNQKPTKRLLSSRRVFKERSEKKGMEKRSHLLNTLLALPNLPEWPRFPTVRFGRRWWDVRRYPDSCLAPFAHFKNRPPLLEKTKKGEPHKIPPEHFSFVLTHKWEKTNTLRALPKWTSQNPSWKNKKWAPHKIPPEKTFFCFDPQRRKNWLGPQMRLCYEKRRRFGGWGPPKKTTTEVAYKKKKHTLGNQLKTSGGRRTPRVNDFVRYKISIKLSS